MNFQKVSRNFPLFACGYFPLYSLAMSSNVPVKAEASFSQVAAVVLSRIQRSCADLLESLPKSLNRAVDLERVLGLDKKLAWQIFKIAHANNPLAEGLNIPSRASVSRLADSALANRVPKPVVSRLISSIEEFESFINEYAGDRRTFESMISGISGVGQEQIDLAHKRSAFRAQSHIWGVHAKTRLLCFIYNASLVDPSMADVIAFRGLLGVHRTRQDATCLVTTTRIDDEDGVIRHLGQRKLLDGAYEPIPGVSVMSDYCTHPLPRLRYRMVNGWVDIEMEGDEIGARSASSCILGDYWQAAFRLYPDEHNRQQHSIANIHTPSESLILDVLVNQNIFGRISPRVFVYGKQLDSHPQILRDSNLLSIRESVTCLGKGTDVMHTPLVPRYTEMVSRAMHGVGWRNEDFGIYRCLVQYPVMPSAVSMRFDLPLGPEHPTA